jgi:hypothetical protein
VTSTEQTAAPEPRRGRGQPLKHGEPLVRFPLRLPQSLDAELRVAAERAGRSLNDEIVLRCSAGAPGVSPRSG